jgi:hypothetical protein
LATLENIGFQRLSLRHSLRQQPSPQPAAPQLATHQQPIEYDWSLAARSLVPSHEMREPTAMPRSFTGKPAILQTDGRTFDAVASERLGAASTAKVIPTKVAIGTVRAQAKTPSGKAAIRLAQTRKHTTPTRK